jgi:hypoxia up-regulated 1
MHYFLLYCLATFLALLPRLSLASVLAIDYGTDYIKASLMKPGVPFDVLLNKDSKRKIQSSVAWKGDDRLFGADAFNLVRQISHLVAAAKD